MDKQIAGFVQTVRQRNIRETTAAVLLSIVFGLQLVFGNYSTLAVVGRVILLIAAVIVVSITWLWLHIPLEELERYPPAENREHWHRRMTAQAVGLKLAWLWYVLPLLVGIVMVSLARTRTTAGAAASIAIPIVLGALLCWMNWSAGRSLENDRDRWLAAP